jgi:hypothetical protein
MAKFHQKINKVAGKIPDYMKENYNSYIESRVNEIEHYAGSLGNTPNASKE